MLSALLFVCIVGYASALKDLGNGAVVSEVVNPAPAPKINPLEKAGAGDVAKDSANDRNAVGFEMRWINGTVPYVIDPSLPANMKLHVTSAIADFHKYTCIKLRTKTASDLDWVIFKGGDGCSSYVGRLGRGGQPVTLAAECDAKGVVIHELMHAIGFGHEQCRPDRDQFITVDLNQVEPSQRHNFQKYDGTGGTSVGKTFGFKYDFGSIMHYSANAFSTTGRPTMSRKDGQPLKVQQNGFGDYDIQKINIYYGCTGGKAPAPQNEFTTTPMPPPAGWTCSKIVVDPSCTGIERKCPNGGYRIGWQGVGGVCTRSCSC